MSHNPQCDLRRANEDEDRPRLEGSLGFGWLIIAKYRPDTFQVPHLRKLMEIFNSAKQLPSKLDWQVKKWTGQRLQQWFMVISIVGVDRARDRFPRVKQ
jgi:hypothetical protein